MKFLDYEGLQTFWAKIKTWIASAVTTNSPSTSKTVTGFSDGKMTYGNIQIAQSQVTDLTTDLENKAPKASPEFTGTPTAPTAATGTNTTQIATTEFVNNEIDYKMSLADAMIYKGPIAGGSSGDYGALTPAADKGYTYKVSVAGKLDGVEVRVGDLLVCNTDGTIAATANNYSTVWANWDYYPANEDGVVFGPASAVDGRVPIFDGATGKIIKDSGKTLGTSVPANAVFTDQSVTAVGNHYAPAEDSTAQLDADASGGTAAWSIDVVTGVTIKRDAKGHVTGVGVDSAKLPANPNSDTKVTQNSNSEDKEFPLLAKNTNNTTNETATAKYAGGVTVNPNKKQITATKFKGALEGNADTASAAAPGSALETAISSKADKVSGATSGNFAGLDANGNLADSGKAPSDFSKVEASSNNGKVKVDGSDVTVYTHPSTTAVAAAAKKVGKDSLGHVVLGDALAKGDVGLGNVDNTADANKQVLDATKLHTARNLEGISFDGSANIHRYGECSTAAGTAAKTVTLADSMTFTLAKGASVFVKFTNSNSVANPTLSVNSTTAASIKRYGTSAPSTSEKTSWKAGSVVHLVYDGTYWQMVGWLNDDTTYSNWNLGQGYIASSGASSSGTYAISAAAYALVTGGIVPVKFSENVPAGAKMNINSKGAKDIYFQNAAIVANIIRSGDTATFMYDGTRYQLLTTDRMIKAAVTGFSDAGTAGTNAKVTYTKGDGTTGDLMVAITDAEIDALT